MSELPELDRIKEAMKVCDADAVTYICDFAETIAMCRALEDYPVRGEAFLQLNGYYERSHALVAGLARLFISSVNRLVKTHARVAELEAALRGVEWGPSDHNGYRLCHACGRVEHHGHHEGCPTGAGYPSEEVKKVLEPRFAEYCKGASGG